MVIYVPGTEETDQKKQNMSLQQLGAAASTLQTSVTTNTADIATNAAAIAAFSSAWSAYTPSSAFATPGTSVMGAANGRWKQIGKTVFFSADCTVTTVGTGAGAWIIGLPTATTAGQVVGASGKEVITSGFLLSISTASTTTVSVNKYDNTSIALLGNGSRVAFVGVYEAA